MISLAILAIVAALGILATVGLLLYGDPRTRAERKARAVSLRRLRAIAGEPEQEAGA